MTHSYKAAGFLLSLAATLSALPSQAEDITRQQAEALMQQCQTERQQNLAPLKTQAIDDCVNVKNKDRAYCERYYQDMGEKYADGRKGPGMFWSLPVCEKAIKAEKYFKQNPGKKTYKTSE